MCVCSCMCCVCSCVCVCVHVCVVCVFMCCVVCVFMCVCVYILYGGRGIIPVGVLPCVGLGHCCGGPVLPEYSIASLLLQLETVGPIAASSSGNKAVSSTNSTPDSTGKNSTDALYIVVHPLLERVSECVCAWREGWDACVYICMCTWCVGCGVCMCMCGSVCVYKRVYLCHFFLRYGPVSLQKQRQLLPHQSYLLWAMSWIDL